MDRFLGKANPEARSPAAAPSALGVCVKVSPKQGMLILEARPGGLPPKNKKEVGESVWRFRLFIGCVSPVPPFQSMYNTSALIPSTSSRWCSQRGQRPLSPAHSASPSPSLSLPLPPPPPLHAQHTPHTAHLTPHLIPLRRLPSTGSWWTARSCRPRHYYVRSRSTKWVCSSVPDRRFLTPF